jgi:hypothetical protein
METIEKENIIEEVISINYYLIKALREDNTKEIIKNKALLNSLLKLYLKEEV